MAPWDKVSPEDQLFVLVTGANSGIGLGICQRLIDEFLEQRPVSAHLILIASTRSVRKSAQTISSLLKYTKHAAETSRTLRSKGGPSYRAQDSTARIHILSVELDLSTLPTIYQAADRLVNSTLSSSEVDALTDVKIPRLDSIILNAGIGGWTGVVWTQVLGCIIRMGLRDAFTYPSFKGSLGGLLVDPLDGKTTSLEAAKNSSNKRLMGEVFCANLFGHYVLAHELLPLLNRPRSSSLPPGRIIWESSIEATDWHTHSPDDFQGIHTIAAYESSKRLTSVLALTADLPAVRPHSASYFRRDDQGADDDDDDDQVVRPRMYLSHPGIVVTALFPINFILFHFYKLAMYVARWLGSPWHPIRAYTGAAAMVWLALQPQDALDGLRAERSSWGSGATRWAGAAFVKETEVEGWGWDGSVPSSPSPPPPPQGGDRGEGSAVLRREYGRKRGAVELTRERREEFEGMAAGCWREMERLRAEWQGRLRVHEEERKAGGKDA